MNEILLAVGGLLLFNTVLIIVLTRRTFSMFREDREKLLRSELRSGREESATAARDLREEVGKGLRLTHDTTAKTIGEMSHAQKAQLEIVATQLRDFTGSNEHRLELLRKTIAEQLDDIRKSNEKKLEEMRHTVDEKLHNTLERRLGESFKLVSDRLEAVQAGLGQMQNLAAGVDDLRKVLTNVKTRGTWGEYQLGAILQDILTPDQYEKNVRTKSDSRESVEYAVRLPGPATGDQDCVWLPIDSKFPQEDYLRLLEASERADSDGVQKASMALNRTTRKRAQEIRDKYVNPPKTTDFAVMFVPTEGLYAEILRYPGLVEQLQTNQRVVVAGPTTLAAILSSLRLGFKSLAIEQRASEVWGVLAAVKTEFRKFGSILSKVKRHLAYASKTIDKTRVRTDAMERKLRDVEDLPPDEATKMFPLESLDNSSVSDEDFDPEAEDVENADQNDRELY